MPQPPVIRFLTVCMILILVIGAGSASVAAQSRARQGESIGSLIVTLGTATLTSGDADPQDLTPEDFAEVRSDDQIAVSDLGEAILTFFDGSESRLAAGTTLTVQTVQVGDAPASMRLTVGVGQVISNVEMVADAEARFEIDTPAAVIAVRGTQFAVFARDDVTQVATLKGTVAVSAQDQTADLPYGFGVAVKPGQAPGAVNVWGQLLLAVSAPVDGADHLPVTLSSTDHDWLFYYRADDLMTAVLGSYDVIVNSPGPVSVPVTFPDDTEANTPLTLDIELGGMAITVTDAYGYAVGDFGDLTVSLTQGDLSGQTTVASGEAFAAGPGQWQIDVTSPAYPDAVVSLKPDVTAGEVTHVSIPESLFTPQK